MPKYMLDYIRLCSTCSMDVRTTGNMLSIVIPSLQAHASALRSAIATVPEGCPEIEEDAEIIEAAVLAGIQRCRPQPIQQDLFAA
jgi:hypothetical protein